MDNHVHLALQVANESLSKIVHNLTFRYTRWFNHRHHRHGHLFAGRYKATIVQAEKYLPDLIRYLHLTPVRLGLTTKPEEYLWSSHRVYLGKEPLSWVNTTLLTAQFNTNEQSEIEAYQAYIVAGMEHGRPKDLVAEKFTGRIFGDESFVTKILAKAEQQTSRPGASLEDLLAIVCHHYSLTEAELVSLGKQRSTSTARGVLAYLVKQCAHISFTELAKRVKRDATTLSAHATRIEKQCKDNKTLNEFVHKVKTQII